MQIPPTQLVPTGQPPQDPLQPSSPHSFPSHNQAESQFISHFSSLTQFCALVQTSDSLQMVPLPVAIHIKTASVPVVDLPHTVVLSVSQDSPDFVVGPLLSSPPSSPPQVAKTTSSTPITRNGMVRSNPFIMSLRFSAIVMRQSVLQKVRRRKAQGA
jgi:hypothetical protein